MLLLRHNFLHFNFTDWAQCSSVGGGNTASEWVQCPGMGGSNVASDPSQHLRIVAGGHHAKQNAVIVALYTPHDCCYILFDFLEWIQCLSMGSNDVTLEQLQRARGFPILSGVKFDTAITNHSQSSLLLLNIPNLANNFYKSILFLHRKIKSNSETHFPL